MHPLTYRIAKRVVAVEHIGLANLIAGKRVAPELIQDAATPDALATALLPLIEDGPVRETTLRELEAVRVRLVAQDARPAAEHVADLAAELVAA
jgi:lipid-A-disaccharide synthase